MKLHFYLRFSSQYGEQLYLKTNISAFERVRMEYLNDEYWTVQLELPADVAKDAKTLKYYYILHGLKGEVKEDWGAGRDIDLLAQHPDNVQIMDNWTPMNQLEHVFMTQPFRKVSMPTKASTGTSSSSAFTHIFKVKVPILAADEVLCLVGGGNALHDWSRELPVFMQYDGTNWVVGANLTEENFPLPYKYAVFNTAQKQVTRYEYGSNRTLFAQGTLASRTVVLHDGYARLPIPNWRGAGVAIPVFSLRTEKSGGVGEFLDLLPFADWAARVGMKMIQLLPVNDTTAKGNYEDSYPYKSVSAFALHPLYLHLEAVAGKAQQDILKPFAKKLAALNTKDVVDYEAVIALKWEALRLLYAAQKANYQKDKDYINFYNENEHWLKPYAVFCCLRDRHKSADFGTWSILATYSPSEVEKFAATSAKHHDEVAIHYFVQYHLHLQLKTATDYAHSKGLAVKGDIPIGIGRQSCDAWVAPELYNMSRQSGAPPDDFAAEGQNWTFPTYNWARMKDDGYQWWAQRFTQMSHYFDAFRIDHILGFFRIWSIPLDAVQGILGRFVPAIPVELYEFYDMGIGFSYQRFCKPFINKAVLNELFGTDALQVVEQYLDRQGDNDFNLKSAYQTQRSVEAHFAQLEQNEQNNRIKLGLYALIANVILLEEEGSEQQKFHFRFAMEKTASFKYLDGFVQQKLRQLSHDYFYKRQDTMWRKEAMEKLPSMKRASEMLICGEDLGTVPDCVPGVMEELGLLSLEIQRMPKRLGEAFARPQDAPYLSVVTPATHDMSTIRGWWAEDRDTTQRFL